MAHSVFSFSFEVWQIQTLNTGPLTPILDIFKSRIGVSIEVMFQLRQELTQGEITASSLQENRHDDHHGFLCLLIYRPGLIQIPSQRRPSARTQVRSPLCFMEATKPLLLASDIGILGHY